MYTDCTLNCGRRLFFGDLPDFDPFFFSLFSVLAVRTSYDVSCAWTQRDVEGEGEGGGHAMGV